MRSYLTLKTIIVIIICSMLVLEGCYSYSVVGNKDVIRIPPQEESILVFTIDGQEIEVEPYHFVEIREPSNLVYGVGKRAVKNTGDYEQYHGEFRPIGRTTEDALILNGWRGTAHVSRSVFILEDSSRVRMDESDFVVVDSSRGTGLWCAGIRRDGQIYAHFSGRISFERIGRIEVKRLSTLKTVALGVGFAVVVALIAVASAFSNMKPGLAPMHF